LVLICVGNIAVRGAPVKLHDGIPYKLLQQKHTTARFKRGVKKQKGFTITNIQTGSLEVVMSVSFVNIKQQQSAVGGNALRRYKLLRKTKQKLLFWAINSMSSRVKYLPQT
jgi:hypothetical protein